MLRILSVSCLMLAACRPAADPTPAGDRRTSDALVERAVALDADFLHEAPPTMAAAEAHALKLAELSHQASSLRPGPRHPYGARRLASIADLVRDELLACRAPLWELRLPPGSARGITYFPWLSEHRGELRRGMNSGWTTSRRAVAEMIAELDRRLRGPRDRDSELYVVPPLREHRDFLRDDLAPSARTDAGLAQLPTGPQCFAARARLLIGTRFDAAATRVAAAQVLEEPQMLDSVDISQHPALVATSNLSSVWRPNAAVVRGERLLRHTREDRRGPAIVAVVAAGALIDLALHADGDETAVERLRRDAPWIPRPTFDALVGQSIRQPLWWLTTFDGYRALLPIRRDVSPDEFHERMMHLGALEMRYLEREFEIRR